jgi:hypothetical protein
MRPPGKTFGLLAAVLLVGLPHGAQSADTNTAVVRAARVWGFPGRTVGVPVGLTHTGGVSAVQLDLSYAANKLVPGAYQAGRLSNNIVLRSRQLGPGRQRVLAYTKDVANMATNQPLGSMPFTVPAGDFAGGGPVGLTDVLVSRTNAAAASPLRIFSGAVVVAPVFIGEDGVVDLFLRVLPNRTYIVQATTDFAGWVNVATNFAGSEYLFAADASAFGLPRRFYRAVSLSGEASAHIELAQLQADGTLTFSYPSTPGRTYVVQASTNLVTWIGAVTNVAGSPFMSYTNLDTTKAWEFFRVLELP